MQESRLFMLLPDYISTPDSMTIAPDGDLVLSCPNFADMSMPSCIARITPEGTIRKWFDVPLNPETNEARSMGIEFGPDGDLYIIDNQGWTEREDLVFQGRVIRVRMNGDKIEKVTTVACGMEHPNGIRIRDGYMYITQSYLRKVKTESGKMMSCVYRFALDDENIRVTNTLEDKNICATFITEDPDCQYGVDGITFGIDGAMYVGNFGDGEIYRVTFNEDGTVKENVPWAKDRSQLRSTDGMVTAENGDIYIADFNVNAIAKVTPEGKITRIAQSPDCDGLHGELDQPGEPIIWNGKIIASCFDLVTDETKVNTAHEMPATLAMLELE